MTVVLNALKRPDPIGMAAGEGPRFAPGYGGAALGSGPFAWLRATPKAARAGEERGGWLTPLTSAVPAIAGNRPHRAVCIAALPTRTTNLPGSNPLDHLST